MNTRPPIINGRNIILEDQGMIIEDKMIAWYDATRYKPRKGQGVIVVLEEVCGDGQPYGNRMIEMAEWNPDLWGGDGWALCGGDAIEPDHKVVAYTHDFFPPPRFNACHATAEPDEAGEGTA
jgi:hypothetical protein